MKKEIAPGLKFTVEGEVTEKNTALAIGSGNLRVLATPYMAAMMENAAYRSIWPCLDDTDSSVGVRLELAHSAATPVGMKIRIESEVTAVDGRRITFGIKAYDDAGLIGECVHERVIVNEQRFMNRTYDKLGK